MPELEGAWGYAASLQASVIFGLVVVATLVRKAILTGNGRGNLSQRAAGIWALGASFYTFILLVISQMTGGPQVSELIALGFGNDRMAVLLIVVLIDQAIRLLDYYLS